MQKVIIICTCGCKLEDNDLFCKGCGKPREDVIHPKIMRKPAPHCLPAKKKI